MAIHVAIYPSADTVVMLNEPETSTAYSLSGHVSITLTSSSSYFEKARAVKVLLRSLTLTFEGHSELITHETGYSATRLISIKRELAPLQAMMLTNDGHESSDKPCTWNFVFDVPIPGWLPASGVFGSDLHGPAGTRYALFAEARFAQLDEGVMRGWSLSSLCSSLGPKERVVRAPLADIRVVRYMLPPVSLTDDEPAEGFADATYVIETRFDAKKRGGSSRIPLDVLSKIEVLASVPECVGLDDETIKLTVRMRASDLTLDQQRRLRLSEFEIKLNQHEHFSKEPSQSYTANFPLPPKQPEYKPLLNSHPVKSLYDIGLVSPMIAAAGDITHFSSSFSLLPSKHVGKHRLAGGGVPFAQEAQRSCRNAWCKLEVNIPFVRYAAGDDVEWERRNGLVKALRPSEDSPLLETRHDLQVELVCTYDAEDGAEPAKDRLVFPVPVVFGRIPPAKTMQAPIAPMSPPSPASSVSSLPSTAVSEIPSVPSPAYQDAFALPAYSQLFHPNGDRRTDYTLPLPAYSPRGEPACVVAAASSAPHCHRDEKH